jgi:hypothetical protein
MRDVRLGGQRSCELTRHGTRDGSVVRRCYQVKAAHAQAWLHVYVRDKRPRILRQWGL